ncbi:peptidylprolyl isomerase [candidate division FCPU426 bacterium]|nr:peptidylprolyl isomerase [candidate division FCPU426 bacterium]
MMNTMRKHTKTILWIVVIAFVGTIFFVWGMDLGRRASSLEQVSAAVVNGEPIDYAVFGRYWEQHYRQVAGDTERELSPQEMHAQRSELMDSLIDRVLLMQFFKKMKLTVSPQEVAARISGMSSFSDNGTFSREKYLTMLNYNRVSPEEFEAEQADAIKFLKISQVLQDSVVVTEKEIRDYFAARSRKLKIQMLAFHWKNMLPQTKPSEEEIAAYFNGHRQQYDQPEEVKVSHILIRLASNNTEEEKLTAKLKLDNIRTDIIKGADFAEMARKHSEDPGSKDQGGDLGFFRRGQMVKAFEDAAFALKTNELSEIVETPFGFHLLKATGRREAKKSGLEEVRPDIIRILKEQQARSLAQKNALEFMPLLKNHPSLEKAAHAAGLPLTTTSWILEDSDLPGIENSEIIVNRVFNLPLQKPSPAILAGEGIYFAEVIAEEYRPFNEALYALEHDTLLEKVKQLRAEQAMTDWLKQARAEAKIVNNVAKESLESENNETLPPADANPSVPENGQQQ